MVVDSAARFRVKKSESFAMIVWSNVAILLVGRIRVQYDNGQQDDFRLNELTTSSDRSTNFTNCGQHLAKYDGYVTSCRVGSQSSIDPQRGQIYMQLIQVSDPNVSSSVVTVLSCGYIVAGHTPALGEFVEPGPAGGPGAYRTVTGINPAAGALPADNVPAGAIWRLRSYEAVLVTDATVGNRSFALVIDDATSSASRIFAVNNANTQAATLARTWAWFAGFDASATVGASFTDTQVLLPSYALRVDLLLLGTMSPASVGPSIRLVSTGALAFTATDDFAGPVIEVEEWVMPN